MWIYVFYSLLNKKYDNDVDEEEKEEEEFKLIWSVNFENFYLLAAAAAAILHLASFCTWMSPATFYFSF